MYGFLGGGGCHFSAKHCTLDGAHKHGTAPFIHFYSESLLSSAFLFSGRAGTPLGQTSPCLWTETYFFNFCQSCNLRAFTGTQPSLRGMAHRPSVVRSTFHCLINRTLRRYGAFLPGYQAHAEIPEPTLHPRSAPFCASTAFVVHPGKQQPVA